MRIEKLTLTNYRCFEHREIEFAPGFNVLIGDNMSGKTSVLDALAVLLGRAMGGYGGGPQDFAPMDVRAVPGPGAAVSQPVYPLRLALRGQYGVKAFQQEYRRASDRSAGWRTAEEPVIYDAGGNIAIESDFSRTIPILASFGVDQGWARREPGPIAILPAPSRLEGYDDWWQPAVGLEHLRAFAAQMVGEMHESAGVAPAWESLAGTVSRCLPDMPTVSYQFRARDWVAVVQDQAVALYTLSDGYRRILATTADLARRCYILNPHLGAEAQQQTPGVVLIDELDLHLHPKWQRTIVDSLKRAFPLIQFIATTHSPFIIQSLEPGELIRLDGPVGEYADESIEDIAGHVMDVPGEGLSARLVAVYELSRKYEVEVAKGPAADIAKVRELEEQLMLATARASNEPAMVLLRAQLESRRLVAGVGDEP